MLPINLRRRYSWFDTLSSPPVLDGPDIGAGIGGAAAGATGCAGCDIGPSTTGADIGPGGGVGDGAAGCAGCGDEPGSKSGRPAAERSTSACAATRRAYGELRRSTDRRCPDGKRKWPTSPSTRTKSSGCKSSGSIRNLQAIQRSAYRRSAAHAGDGAGPSPPAHPAATSTREATRRPVLRRDRR